MLSIKDAKTVLTQIGLSDKQIENYESNIEPFIDLHKYVMKENDISSDAAEKLADTFVKEYFTEYMKTHNIDENFNELVLAGEAMKEFALIQKYDALKAEKLVESTYNIMQIFNEFFNTDNNI